MRPLGGRPRSASSHRLARSTDDSRDSIFFHATAPHYVVNAGRRTAVTIWAIAPPTY